MGYWGQTMTVWWPKTPTRSGQFCVGFAVLCLGLGSCAHRRNAETLAKIYRHNAQQAVARCATVVFVPGIEGSALLDPATRRFYWGAWWVDAPKSDDPAARRKLALPMALGQPLSKLDDDLEAGPPLLDVELGLPTGGVHVRGYKGVFEGLLAHLRDPEIELAKGHALPLETIRHGNLPIVEHGYDWRRDISLEAMGLHRTVLAAIRKSSDTDRRVDLVGHSMGGLLVRWYLRYGAAALPDDGSLPELTWAGAKYVRRALIVATPNGGSPAVIEGLLEGEQPSWALPKYPAAVIGTFPAVYELLPRTADGNVVDRATGKPVDLYDVRLWERWGWGLLDPRQAEVLAQLLPEVADAGQRRRIARDHLAKVLRRAQAFHAALDAPSSPPASLRLHLFMGDNAPTPAVLGIDAQSGKCSWLRSEPGDGRVTRRSALRDRRPSASPGRLTSAVDWHSVHFVDADHMGITANPGFLDDALYLLLDAPDPPAPADGDQLPDASPR